VRIDYEFSDYAETGHVQGDVWQNRSLITLLDNAGSGTGDLGETEATCTTERCNRLLIRNGKLCVACRSRARSACKKLVSKFEGATLRREAQEAYTAYKGSVHACPQRGPHQSHTTWLEVQELLEAAWKTHEKSSIATLVSHIHGE
jgi:hypothetical protein